MPRDFFIQGESMVSVKSRSDSDIGSLTQLGLAEGPIRVSLNTRYDDIKVNAFGTQIPVDVQWMLADATIVMNLVHINRDTLDVCLRLAMGLPSAVGQVARAGTRMGGGNARFAVGNNFIGLNIASPVASKPWRFYATYLAGNQELPVGVERSIFALSWRALPYSTDPWGGGTGAANTALFDYVADT